MCTTVPVCGTYLFRELDERDLRDEEGGSVARESSRAQDEAPHHVAVAAHHLDRNVLPRLGAFHPARHRNFMKKS